MSKNNIGRIDLEARVNKKGFTQDLNSITSLAKKAGKILAGAFAFKKIFDFGKESIGLAASLEQTEGLVNQVFKTMGKDVDNFAKHSASQYGLTELMAKKYTSMYGAMSQAMGFTEKDAYKMSTSLTALAGDLTSVFDGMSQDEAYTKLKAVFSGETEGLKDLGVVMNQTSLDSFAMARGFGKVTADMTEAEKVALRYQFVMDRLSYASGNYAREATTWSGMVSKASLDIQAAMTDIGAGLLRVFKPVLGIVGAVIAKIREFAAYFKAFIYALTGAKAEGGISQPIMDAGAAADAVGQNMQDAGDSIDKANNMAKKLKKTMLSMLGIDELNILQSPQSQDDEPSSGGSSSSSAGGIGGIPNIDIPALKEIKGPEIDTSGMEKFAQKAKDLFEKAKKAISPFIETVKGIDFGPIGAALAKLWGSMKPILGKIYSNFAWVLNKVIGPFIKWVTEKVVPKAITIVAEALEAANPLLEAFSNAGHWIWETFLEPIANFAAPIFEDTLDFIIKALDDFGNWAEENKPLIEDIALVVEAFAAAWLLVNGAITLWNTIGVIATGVTSAFGAAVAFLTSPIGIAVAAIGGIIAVILLLIKHWDKVKEVAQRVWNKVQEIWSKVADWIYENVIRPVEEFFKGLIDGLVEGARKGYDWITGVFRSIGNWFRDNVTEPIKNTFSRAFDAIGKFISDKWNWILGLFSSGGEFFKGFAESVGSVFVRIVNGLIDGINWVIAKPFDFINGILNDISGVSILGARPFGWIGHNPIPVPQLPYLAQGGFVERNTPRLAVIGDNKRYGEVVAPENKLNELLDRAILRAKGDEKSSGGNLTVILKLEDDITLAKTVIEGYNKLAKQN